LFLVIADQVTKLSVKGFNIPFLKVHYDGMAMGSSIDVLGSFLRLTYVENPGMAFGIELGGVYKFFLSLFSILASIGLLYYMYRIRNEKFLMRFSLAMILGGAVGNLIDRVFYGVLFDYAPLFYGRVVDFFDMDFFKITVFGHTYDRFPIFNIADVAVSLGVLLLIISHGKEPEKEKQTELAEITDKNEELNEQSDNRKESQL
jgi:signal peptidase II